MKLILVAVKIGTHTHTGRWVVFMTEGCSRKEFKRKYLHNELENIDSKKASRSLIN